MKSGKIPVRHPRSSASSFNLPRPSMKDFLGKWVSREELEDMEEAAAAAAAALKLDFTDDHHLMSL